jgi:hypothetical protein
MHQQQLTSKKRSYADCLKTSCLLQAASPAAAPSCCSKLLLQLLLQAAAPSCFSALQMFKIKS